MKVRLSEHFTFKKIFLITIAPILMMVFTSLYCIVDGLFISNFASKDAFAGVNLIFPIIMIVGGIGFMLGAGGSALVSKLLGEKKEEYAKQVFTMIIIFTILIGATLSILGSIFIEPLANLLSLTSKDSTEEMVKEATKYGRILMLGQVLFMLQNVYQTFFAVDEKPVLGFAFTVGAGLTNMLFDWILIGILKMGVEGAAIATISGYIVGGLGPTLYFLTHKNDYISFRKTKLKISPLWQSCFNGSSEFVNNISSSVVSIVFNFQLLKYFGNNGVSSYGILMYISFAFIAIFLGYGAGIAPATSYHYGANNKEELNNILKKSLLVTFLIALVMCTLSFTLAEPLACLFANGDAELIKLTVTGMRIYALAYLCIGLCIYISTFFTALNNGLISAILSFTRTLILQVSLVLILPTIFGKDIIYWSIFFSEVGAITLAFIFLFSHRKKYGYFDNFKRK